MSSFYAVSEVVEELRTELEPKHKRVEWRLRLACGHVVSRSVSYLGTQWQQAPSRCKCEECARVSSMLEWVGDGSGLDGYRHT